MKAKMKMLVSLVCGTLLMAVVPMSAMAAWANPFKDVQPGAWYYGAVEYANTKGLFSGTAPDKFSPNDNKVPTSHTDLLRAGSQQPPRYLRLQASG